MIEMAEYRIELEGIDAKTCKVGASTEGVPTIEVASPPEFGGPGDVWSPEHMFLASISTCLMTTFQAIAAMSGLEVVDYRDEAEGRLERGDNGLYRFELVTLRPRMLIADERLVSKAERLMDKAKNVCLIGRSVNTEIVVEPTVTTLGPPSSRAGMGPLSTRTTSRDTI